MDIQLIEANPQHAQAIGRICFQAFKGIMDKHHLPLDIPSEEVGVALMSARISGPDFHGFVALVDGQPAGANFYSHFDEWAGVGPLVIDPARQGFGLGKRLMQAVVDHATASGFKRIRLLQDAVNMVSLSLYTSLGFTVTEPIVLLQIPESSSAHPDVRLLTLDDIETCGQLSTQLYGVNRSNETAYFIKHGPAMGVVPLGLDRNGQLQGYCVPGFFGHGVAHTNEDLLALIHSGASMSTHPATHRWLCPSRKGDLFRLALSHGHRASRGLHSMAIGPWNPPDSPWFCSIEG